MELVPAPTPLIEFTFEVDGFSYTKTEQKRESVAGKLTRQFILAHRFDDPHGWVSSAPIDYPADVDFATLRADTLAAFRRYAKQNHLPHPRCTKEA